MLRPWSSLSCTPSRSAASKIARTARTCCPTVLGEGTKWAATLRGIVSDYRSFHPTVHGRAMNRVGAFVDASLAAPLLAALADQEYGCQAWAAMGCARC